MVRPVLYRSAPAVLGAFALLACDDAGAPTAPAGPERAGEVAIHIAPLSLASVGDATWRLTVANAAHETVWTRDITADAYGDGAGSVSYVGPCDADGSPPDNTVTVELLELRAAGGAVIPTTTYMVPPPATRTVRCVEGADVAVDFDITVARAAQQGFFDFAISFNASSARPRSTASTRCCTSPAAVAARPRSSRWPAPPTPAPTTPGSTSTPSTSRAPGAAPPSTRRPAPGTSATAAASPRTAARRCSTGRR